MNEVLKLKFEVTLEAAEEVTAPLIEFANLIIKEMKSADDVPEVPKDE